MDRVLILNTRRWKYNPIEGITKRKKMAQSNQSSKNSSLHDGIGKAHLHPPFL